MKILILDNYDSFTYNLVHIVQTVCDGTKIVCDVRRNSKITISECESYDKFIFSPGPGIPSEAGILKPIIRAYAGTKSMLGVCLGHQAIAEVFGGTLSNLENVYHGVSTEIHVTQTDYLFYDLPQSFKAGRYHSWIVDPGLFPAVLECIACDDNEMIMALRHRQHDIRGVQFHPESIMTPVGESIVKNFIHGPY